MTNNLRQFTTMKIGGTVEHLISLEVFLAQIQMGEKFPEPIRFLGNGSNVLIDDEPLQGTIVHTRLKEVPPIDMIENNSEFSLVKIPAGIFLPALSKWAAQKSLSGCEFMVGIPGTLGGAVVQNAGANGQEIKDILVGVEMFDPIKKEIRKFSASELMLRYRSSALKSTLKKWLVGKIILKLQKSSQEKIEKQVEENLNYRKTKTPYQKPSLGSIYTRIPKPDGSWWFPGELIEKAGFKGKRIGGAMVSNVHANYIVNEGDAKFVDVIALMNQIEAQVLKECGVKLHREVLIWSDR